MFFFEKKNVYEFFSALERRIVILWRWISNRLSKLRLVCLEELFQGDCFFSEKNFNSLVVSLKNWAEPFKKFKTMKFWQKTISTVVTSIFHASRGTLCGFFSRKRIICKMFSQLERKFVTSCRSFPTDSWKVHHCIQMNLLRVNMFFYGNILVFISFFSVVETKIVWLWQKKINNIVKFAFSSF